MSWNYRIIKKTYYYSQGEKEDSYGICEVYYDDNDEIEGWTEDFVGIGGSDLKELENDLEHYKEAFCKPILDEKELEKQLEERRQ